MNEWILLARGLAGQRGGGGVTGDSTAAAAALFFFPDEGVMESMIDRPLISLLHAPLHDDHPQGLAARGMSTSVRVVYPPLHAAHMCTMCNQCINIRIYVWYGMQTGTSELLR